MFGIPVPLRDEPSLSITVARLISEGPFRRQQSHGPPLRRISLAAAAAFTSATSLYYTLALLWMDAAALLKKSGWRGDGHSLDSKNRGLAKPLLISKKNDFLGVGIKKHNVSDQWWMRAFDESLKTLGTGQQTTLSQVRDHGLAKGGLYGFFVKGEGVPGTIGNSTTSTTLTSTTVSGVSTPAAADSSVQFRSSTPPSSASSFPQERQVNNVIRLVPQGPRPEGDGGDKKDKRKKSNKRQVKYAAQKELRQQKRARKEAEAAEARAAKRVRREASAADGVEASATASEILQGLSIEKEERYRQRAQEKGMTLEEYVEQRRAKKEATGAAEADAAAAGETSEAQAAQLAKEAKSREKKEKKKEKMRKKREEKKAKKQEQREEQERTKSKAEREAARQARRDREAKARLKTLPLHDPATGALNEAVLLRTGNRFLPADLVAVRKELKRARKRAERERARADRQDGDLEWRKLQALAALQEQFLAQEGVVGGMPAATETLRDKVKRMARQALKEHKRARTGPYEGWEPKRKKKKALKAMKAAAAASSK